MTSATELAIEAVMAKANGLLHVREVPRGSNRSPDIDKMNRLTGAPLGSPWCASFVAHCGHWALGQKWPLKLTASCQALYLAHTRLVIPQAEAREGDLFLLWYPALKRYAHVGFVASANRNGVIATLEGNTNDGGSRDGWGVFARQRTLKAKDVILRWSSPWK